MSRGARGLPSPTFGHMYGASGEPVTLSVEKHRIAIIGPPGSGKTTLATTVGRRLGLEAIDLDDHLMVDGRTAPESEQRELISELLSGDAWIVEGAYWRVAEVMFSEASIIVLMDAPLHRALPRFVRRALREAWVGWNWETIRAVVALRSALGWAWSYPVLERRRVLAAANAARGHARVVVARTLEEAERGVRLATDKVNAPDGC